MYQKVNRIGIGTVPDPNYNPHSSNSIDSTRHFPAFICSFSCILISFAMFFAIFFVIFTAIPSLLPMYSLFVVTYMLSATSEK